MRRRYPPRYVPMWVVDVVIYGTLALCYAAEVARTQPWRLLWE